MCEHLNINTLFERREKLCKTFFESMFDQAIFCCRHYLFPPPPPPIPCDRLDAMRESTIAFAYRSQRVHCALQFKMSTYNIIRFSTITASSPPHTVAQPGGLADYILATSAGIWQIDHRRVDGRYVGGREEGNRDERANFSST